ASAGWILDGARDDVRRGPGDLRRGPEATANRVVFATPGDPSSCTCAPARRIEGRVVPWPGWCSGSDGALFRLLRGRSRPGASAQTAYGWCALRALARMRQARRLRIDVRA